MLVKDFNLNVGDLVWFMYKDKPTCGKISKMWYRKAISCVDFESITEVERYYVTVDEKAIGDFELTELFPDKESLIKSL